MSNEANREKYFTTSEACNLAGTCRPTFLRWVREGKIEDVKMRDRNGWRLFTEEEVRTLSRRANYIVRSDTESWTLP